MHILLLLTNPCNEKYDTLVEMKKILSMHVSSFVDIFLLILNPIIKVEHKSFNFLIFQNFLEHYHGVLGVKKQFMVQKDNDIG